jgi:hypothetical protein
LLVWLGAAAALIAGSSCAEPADESATVETVPTALQGDNLAGFNLAGFNLAGFNLAGFNLGGPNLGGNNLAGFNLAGTNLAGTNLGGNNLGGMNLAGTNLAGFNLAGFNLAGFNLAGTNLAGSNLAGSNLAGTNLAGFNLAGFNLAGFNLAGPVTGQDIHGLGVPIKGMLYSGEDLWMPKTGRCIVLGIGSTAFPKLLAQQSANARMSVALGKLPWGFPGTTGGSVTDAWEAVVWGDRSYCTFVMVAPPGASWAGVAGFIKAIFRWNATPMQSMDISGIEASAAVDPTLSTQIATYTGMMAAAGKFNAGVIKETDFVAGELAFVTATTNNQTVRVDFSSWARDSSNNGLVLGNVESVNPPQYAEGVYYSYGNTDGTVGVSVSNLDVASNLISAYADLANSYTAYRYGQAPKPIPSRCGGSLYLNYANQEPIPAGKCDSGLSWTPTGAGYPSGNKSWSTIPGTTAPMNLYMSLPYGAANPNPYLRAAGRPILSETYIFLWEPNHSLQATAIGGSSGSDRTSLGVAVSNAAACGNADDVNAAFNGLSTSKWCGVGTPTTSAPKSIMYMWGAAIPITSYRITSAVDAPNRDPKNWTFQGCNGTCTVGSDTGWVTLDTRSNQVFETRLLSKAFAFTNATAYSQYRLRVVANKGNDISVQLRELQMFDSGGAVVSLPGVDRTENGTVTWTGKACSTNELATRAFDNLMTSTGATRWCVAGVPSAARPASIVFSSSAAAQPITSYKITSASDFPARDPRDWTFQACDGSCKVGADAGWVTLDSRSSETFASRFQTKTYTLGNTAAYSQYRLRVTANGGDTARFQLGELEVF